MNSDVERIVDWWSGTQGNESHAVLMIERPNGRGGVFAIHLLGSQPSFVGWAVEMADRDGLRAAYEAEVLRRLIAGDGQSPMGHQIIDAMLAQHGIDTPSYRPAMDFSLKAHQVSIPAGLPGEEFMRAATTPGWVALQRPREEWRGLMAVPADEPVLLITASGSVQSEPNVLVEAMAGIGRRRSFTAPALFEVATGGSSPLQIVDLLAYDRIDLRDRPWSERRALMLEVLAEMAGAGARLDNIAAILAQPAGQSLAVEAWQLWLTPSDAVYGSMLRRWTDN